MNRVNWHTSSICPTLNSCAFQIIINLNYVFRFPICMGNFSMLDNPWHWLTLNSSKAQTVNRYTLLFHFLPFLPLWLLVYNYLTQDASVSQNTNNRAHKNLRSSRKSLGKKRRIHDKVKTCKRSLAATQCNDQAIQWEFQKKSGGTDVIIAQKSATARTVNRPFSGCQGMQPLKILGVTGKGLHRLALSSVHFL